MYRWQSWGSEPGLPEFQVQRQFIAPSWNGVQHHIWLMLKSYKMAPCPRVINSYICPDKRQLFCPEGGRTVSKFITCWIYFKQTHCSLPERFFPYPRQSEVPRHCGSCWEPTCFSWILDFTPISVGDFFFSYGTNFWWRQEVWLGKNSCVPSGR